VDVEARLRALLPEEFQDSYPTLSARPMRSAGLKYGRDGRVAWDEIWGSFCDLAMAGGPPHKGTLLGPPPLEEIVRFPGLYVDAVREVCRGINMVTDFVAEESPDPGWIRVVCGSEVMAGWLLRAITIENVAVRQDGLALELPIGPHYRLEKEIKNVITVVAKTFHYWDGHMSATQQRQVAALLAEMDAEAALLRPEAGWRAVDCGSVDRALWTARLLIGVNVLARREGAEVLVPVDPVRDPDGRRIADALARVEDLVAARLRS
jgi:sirohydrochlorin cobaltochelatase